MLHIYFGAFDFVMYAIAVIGAIFLADAICDEGNEQQRLQEGGKGASQGLAQPEEGPLIVNGPIFELHGTLVVKKSDVPIVLPEGLKALSLRGNPVIRLSDLVETYGMVALDATQVIQKWEQWKEWKRKKKPRKQTPEPKAKGGPLSNGSWDQAATALADQPPLLGLPEVTRSQRMG
ncbi:hypothetical protein NDI52_28595 [Leptolyngbya sp. PL-A3]|uniref:hypothetical protein n=1 Tax=Leptolyngbya sp. PL-A3 TaxID=2933911 RepID=UPI0032991C5F